MLAEHSDRICVYCAIDFEPQLGARLAEAADLVMKRSPPEKLTVKFPGAYHFRWPSKARWMQLTVGRLFWQTIGLSAWMDGRQEQVDLARSVLDTLKVEQLKRIGFKVTAYLPLGMSHAEMCRLMFGTLVGPLEELGDVFGQPKDPFIQLDGSLEDAEYVLQCTPMSQAQLTTALLQTPNLDQLAEHPFLRSGVTDFYDRVTDRDSLFFDIDLFRREVSKREMGTFVAASLTKAESIATATVKRLQSKPTNVGS